MVDFLSVKCIGDQTKETAKSFRATLSDGTVIEVPNIPGARYREEIFAWAAAGGVIDPEYTSVQLAYNQKIQQLQTICNTIETSGIIVQYNGYQLPTSIITFEDQHNAMEDVNSTYVVPLNGGYVGILKSLLQQLVSSYYTWKNEYLRRKDAIFTNLKWALSKGDVTGLNATVINISVFSESSSGATLNASNTGFVFNVTSLLPNSVQFYKYNYTTGQALPSQQVTTDSKVILELLNIPK